MKLALRSTLLASALLSLSPMATVQAAKPEKPKSVKQLKSYEFVVTKKGDEYTMRIVDEEYGPIGGKRAGFITYQLATWKNKDLVHIEMVKGVRKTRGVGKMLKDELLRQYPKRSIKSELALVNLKKLLKVWATGYPHSSTDKNGEMLRDSVPALSFEGFDYVLTPLAAPGGKGTVSLEMTPAKKGAKGSIVVEKPLAMDKVLVSNAPKFIPKKYRPKSDKDVKKAQRNNESAAKKAADILEKYADKVSRKEGVDDDDLIEHLRDLMNDTCGRGGNSGSGWAEDCLFTKKSSSYVVEVKNGGSSFRLDKWLEDEAEEFVEDNS